MAPIPAFAKLGVELDQLLISISTIKAKHVALPAPRTGQLADLYLADIDRYERRKAELEALLTKKSSFPPCFDHEALRRYVTRKNNIHSR